MNNKYDHAKQLQNNIKLSSDNVAMEECFYLCANKKHIEDLKVKDHQVIWGRRGSGKTTLLKAFTHDVNVVQPDPSIMAIYIVMAKVIPTDEEIDSITGDGSSLAAYIFSYLIIELCKELEKEFNFRVGAMDSYSEECFSKAYCQLQDYLNIYQTYNRGGTLSVENLKSEELKKEIGVDANGNVDSSFGILNSCINIFRKHSKTNNNRKAVIISGEVRFNLETQIISDYISQMLSSFGVSLLYLCLDEYSELDKISKYSIQSKVAQLIKQVFFKTPLYSVKIATIWNYSKLHSRGGNRVEGIEYKQDIFPGPDLDIMFMANNAAVISYFKEVLVNTYLLGDPQSDKKSDKERKALSDYFETEIFGTHGLRHLICGSQGISRAFVTLVKAYLQQFNRDYDGRGKLDLIYEIIKHQYLEDVRNKLPYFTLYKEINTFVYKNLYRYFLITREDYGRCKPLIKYLSSRGLYTQIPGQLTDRLLRDEYKLFVIHYGNYLDALESTSFRQSRKRLSEDAKLAQNGMLVPDYGDELIEHPEKYTLCIPEGAEDEVYCTRCSEIFVSKERGRKVQCPICNEKILRFEDFIDENAL